MPTLDPRIADAPEPADGLSAQGRAQRAKVDVARAIGLLSTPDLPESRRVQALDWLHDAEWSLDPLAYPRLSAIEGGKR